MKKLPADILKLPLSVRAEMALKAAVRKAIEEHIRNGLSIFVWRDGKVTEVSPQELAARYTPTSKR